MLDLPFRMDVIGYVLHVSVPKLPREEEIRSRDGGDVEEGMVPLLSFKELREDVGVVAENLLIVPKYVFDKLVEPWSGK